MISFLIEGGIWGATSARPVAPSKRRGEGQGGRRLRGPARREGFGVPSSGSPGAASSSAPFAAAAAADASARSRLAVDGREGCGKLRLVVLRARVWAGVLRRVVGHRPGHRYCCAVVVHELRLRIIVLEYVALPRPPPVRDLDETACNQRHRTPTALGCASWSRRPTLRAVLIRRAAASALLHRRARRCSDVVRLRTVADEEANAAPARAAHLNTPGRRREGLGPGQTPRRPRGQKRTKTLVGGRRFTGAGPTSSDRVANRARSCSTTSTAPTERSRRTSKGPGPRSRRSCPSTPSARRSPAPPDSPTALTARPRTRRRPRAQGKCETRRASRLYRRYYLRACVEIEVSRRRLTG